MASQMYSRSVNQRRNKTLELRMKLKRNDPSLLVYINYPVVLMVKRSTEQGMLSKENLNFSFYLMFLYAFSFSGRISSDGLSIKIWMCLLCTLQCL